MEDVTYPPQPNVTPFVGVWIETLMAQHIYLQTDVTPFVGVWIETRVMAGAAGVCSVTPFVGVWIETYFAVKTANTQ